MPDLLGMSLVDATAIVHAHGGEVRTTLRFAYARFDDPEQGRAALVAVGADPAHYEQPLLDHGDGPPRGPDDPPPPPETRGGFRWRHQLDDPIIEAWRRQEYGGGLP